MAERNVYKLGISLLFIMLVLTGCASTAGDAPEAVLLAQTFLAEHLNVDVAEIAIVDFEPVEWTDSCFGWGGPAESCAAVMTPGWRVHFEVNQQEYEVRLNESGTQVRLPQTP